MIWSVQNSEQVQAVGEIENSSSERVVAIVCGAMVEQRLEISLKHRLNPHEYTQNRLFKPSGPLGPFANKIDLGFLLYMYDKRTWQALSAICTIRNSFAHRMDQTFGGEDKDFIAAMKLLALHEGVKFYPNPFMWSDTKERIRKPKNNRQIFVTNVKLALVALMRDTMVHMPQSNESLIPMSRAEPIVVPPPVPGGGSYLVKRRGRRHPAVPGVGSPQKPRVS